MNNVSSAFTIDELERAILDELEQSGGTTPATWELRDEQVEHAAEILGGIFREAAEPSAA
ncbi:hypothetical protein [Nonomuraea sp. NEAU-A123]|uniref:hypothetical protein n=1 Tax=Nonomuraea sp. NEAU-A123 TaxID=2839649 RepID=UPI001BE4482F|nr:hypothetical protein [Nonomuraea sp. NEAU-A123]MBT2226296.1 hypothetical protein [Nonomuraea sp. NEAU-A123]